VQLRGVTPGTAGGRGRGQGVKCKNDHQRRHTARPRRSRTLTTMSYAASTSRSLRVARQLAQSTSYYRRGGRMLLPTSSQQNIPSCSSWPPSRFFSNSRRRFDSTSIATGGSTIPPASEATTPRLQLTFTCTVENCLERSTHEFTKRAYETGIVLVTCPKCKNRHLIADHIGWFKESTFGGQLKTVEDLMRAKGEKVTRGQLGPEGVIEFVQ